MGYCRHALVYTICFTLYLSGCADDEDSNNTGEPGSDTTTNAESKPGALYGDVHEGQYHLGPVDFDHTAWSNACAPAGGYRAVLQDPTGLGNEYLAGVSNVFADRGAVCDSCIRIKTAAGREITARIVTYGVTNEPGDIDVSPTVYEALDTGEYPRTMTWQFAKCPDTGPLMYEFQTGAHTYWTSFWVRNQRVPVTKVVVKSASHSTFIELSRNTDGTLNDIKGFGEGEFTLRLSAMDGQVIEDTFPGFSAGELIESAKQFK
jgi:expansin